MVLRQQQVRTGILRTDGQKISHDVFDTTSAGILLLGYSLPSVVGRGVITYALCFGPVSGLYDGVRFSTKSLRLTLLTVIFWPFTSIELR